MKSLILALMVAAACFAGCSISAEHTEHYSTHSSATSNPNCPDVFTMKLKAAEAITTTPERDKALSVVAIDAAKSLNKAGNQSEAARWSAIAVKSLNKIATTNIKDQAASKVAVILAQSNHAVGSQGKPSSEIRQDALTSAKMIVDTKLRDQTLMQLAQLTMK